MLYFWHNTNHMWTSCVCVQVQTVWKEAALYYLNLCSFVLFIVLKRLLFLIISIIPI